MRIPRLPIHEQPLDDESLTGFLRRHVGAMHYDGLRQLLNLIEDQELPSSLDGLPRGEALGALSTLVGRDEEALCAMTFHRWSERLVLRPSDERLPAVCDSKTLGRYFQTARPRICPICLVENPELDRLVWSFRPLGLCAAHDTVLWDHCPGCRKHFLPTRLDLLHCRCGYRVLDHLPIRVTGRVTELAGQVADWLAGASAKSVALPPHAAFWWLDRLRFAVLSTPTWLDRVRKEWALPPELDQESAAWLAAAAFIVEKPAALTEFLHVYQTIEKRRSMATGVGRSFGLLLRDASYLERLGYAMPAQCLRDYLLEHFDRGHLTGKVVLFRSARDRRRLANRSWLDQTAAARFLGVRPPTIKRLVERGALVGRIAEAGHHGRTSGVVSRDSVETLRRNFARQLSTVEAGRQLGMERHRILDLIRAGILREVIRTAQGWRISQACVDQLLGKLHELPPLPNDRSRWISLGEAARRFGVDGLDLVGIVELVLSSRLAARRDLRLATWRGVYLELEAVRLCADKSRATKEADSGYPLNRLAHLLIPGRPLKETVLKKWIRAGLLSARRQRKAWQVTTAEVERFRATYCLAPDVCAHLNIRRGTLARWEVEKRIAPVYGRRTHPCAGASVFLRADVRRLADSSAA